MPRIKALQSHIHDLMVVVDPKEIQYLTGMKLSRGLVFIHPERSKLFVDKRYIERAEHQATIPFELISKDAVTAFLSSLPYTTCLIDPATITVEQMEQLKGDYFSNRNWAHTKIVKEMRFKKSREEISFLKQSAAFNYQGFLHIQKNLQVGVTEKEIAWEFEKYCRERGAEKMAFAPTVAFGEHTSMPHYEPQDYPLQKGMPVLIDVGVVYNGYCSDLTRAFLFEGENPEYEALQEIVHEAYNALLPKLKPGTPLRELYITVNDHFNTTNTTAKFQHNLGHGIGIEVHEWPVLSSIIDEKYVLEEGNVVTIEPGLYKQRGFGYRYENVIAITKNGYEVLV